MKRRFASRFSATPRPIWRRLGIVSVAVTALIPAIDSGTASAATAAPKPGQWTQVTSAGQENITDIGLARGPNGVLHVVWPSGRNPNMSIMDTPISANGTVGKPAAIAKHINQVTFPDATLSGRTLHAFWNQAPDSGSKGEGTAEATWPAGGKHWNAGVGVTTAVNNNWDLGVSADTGADGQPWVVFVTGGGFEALHYGHAKRLISVSGCCVYNPGIGVDDHTSAAWLTWFSNVKNQVGVYARQLKPNGLPVGKPFRLPGSNAGGDAISVNSRTTATGLGHGRAGVYTTYISGWPTTKRVYLIKLGAKKPTTVSTLSNTSGSTLAADPFGRLWVAWYRAIIDQSELFVRRAASGASKFGKTVKVPLPKGTSTLWKVYVNAQAKRLDVLALMTVHGKLAYWSTQVLPPK